MSDFLSFMDFKGPIFLYRLFLLFYWCLILCYGMFLGKTRIFSFGVLGVFRIKFIYSGLV